MNGLKDYPDNGTKLNGRPDDPFGDQCPVDQVQKKYSGGKSLTPPVAHSFVMAWDDFPEGGTFSTVVQASSYAEAETKVKRRMAEVRSEEVDGDPTAEKYFKDYADGWEVLLHVEGCSIFEVPEMCAASGQLIVLLNDMVKRGQVTFHKDRSHELAEAMNRVQKSVREALDADS